MATNSNGQGNGPERRIRWIAGQKVRFDSEGFFEEFDEWSEEVFEALARENAISEITEQHRLVIRALRDFYAYHARAPLNSELRKSTGMRLMEIEHLFPGGIKEGARRLSGLPNPKTCN